MSSSDFLRRSVDNADQYFSKRHRARLLLSQFASIFALVASFACFMSALCWNVSGSNLTQANGVHVEWRFFGLPLTWLINDQGVSARALPLCFASFLVTLGCLFVVFRTIAAAKIATAQGWVRSHLHFCAFFLVWITSFVAGSNCLLATPMLLMFGERGLLVWAFQPVGRFLSSNANLEWPRILGLDMAQVVTIALGVAIGSLVAKLFQ